VEKEKMNDFEKGVLEYEKNSFDTALEYFNKYLLLLKSTPYNTDIKKKMNTVKDYINRAQTKLDFINRFMHGS
jgi:hypothetical protein